MPAFKYSKGPLLRAEKALTETAGDIVSNSIATGNGSQVTERKNQPIDGDDSEAIERIAPTSPVYDRWTRERWLQRLWESSKMKGDISREGHAASVLQIKLWKTCYDVDVDDDDDILRFKELGMWPSTFCGKLSTLICQPLWNDDPTMLATAIQFAVTCRTESVEPWKMALAARNIPEMEVLRRQAESGFPQQLPVELNFLHHLGAFIEKNRRRRYAESDLIKRLSQGIYPITVIDLEAILGALDTFNPNNGLLFSTETIEHIRRCRASNKSFPAGEVVFDLHKRAFLNEWRLFFLEKQAETETEPSSNLVVQLRTAASTREKQRKRAKPSTPTSGGSDEDLESPARRPQKRPRRTTTVIPSDSESDIDEEEDDGFAPPSGGECHDERAQDKPGQRAEKSKTKDVIEDSADELEGPNVADAAATEAGSEVASTDAGAGAAVDVSGIDVDLGTANAEREAEISNIETPRLTNSLPLPAATQTSSVQALQTTQEPTDTQASSEPPVSTGPQKRKLSAAEYRAIRDEMQAKLTADVKAMNKRRYYSKKPLGLW
ncbi:hypothetical protein EsDP_00001339 [Epichloe bromicola]|uniref:Uncharacterized protein n=1 Tax=Epichloe bromicola TaxID=79588 RepID=A0ABQ0CHJ3_9HYPO